MSFDFSIYDYEDTTAAPSKKSQPQASKIEPISQFDFDVYDIPESTPVQEEEEGFLQSSARTALQVPQALLEVTPPGIAAGLWQMLAQGEVLDPEEIEHIKAISEREGIPFDEEKYMQVAQAALGTVPTVSNIARGIEENTGIPLEPKGKLQKALRFATGLGKLQPGTLGQKAISAGTGLATKEALELAGVPEPLAELGGYGAGGYAGSKAPPVDVKFTKQKPSGLPERGFERLSKPTDVPAKKIQTISDKLENDFRKVSDKIIKESPIGETANNLSNDPMFKRDSKALLDQAQMLADKTPGTIAADNYKKALLNQANKQVKGFTLSEYKKNYIKYMQDAVKDIIPENIKYGELVEQFRENNRSLGEYFEPGASKALNRAKKDALLDQNRAIASVLETSHPELSKVFTEGNARWTKIMDAEAVDSFVKEMFPSDTKGTRVDFKHMKDLFDDPNYQRIFKRSLGEEGTKAFERAVEDMLTSERPYKMMREAQEKGLGDFLLSAKTYLISPHLGVAKAGWDTIQHAYRALFNATLDRPRIGFNFISGSNKLKKGEFKAAANDFNKVKKDVEILEPLKLAEKPKSNDLDFDLEVEPIR